MEQAPQHVVGLQHARPGAVLQPGTALIDPAEQQRRSRRHEDGLDDLKSDKVDETITKTTTKTDKKDPNLYAMVALGLGVLGLLLSFTNAKAAIGGAMVTGIGAAGAMIGMMLDVKKKVKLDIPGGDKEGGEISKGIDKISETVSDKMNITVDFTPWFYIAVVAFLAAAFFCYKRMSSTKS